MVKLKTIAREFVFFVTCNESNFITKRMKQLIILADNLISIIIMAFILCAIKLSEDKNGRETFSATYLCIVDCRCVL